MARIAGRNGRLYVGIASAGVPEPIAFLTGWSLDSKVDKIEVTALGDTNKTFVAGLPDRSGTYDGWYDTSTAQLYTAASDGIARKFYAYTDITAPTSDYWWGTAIFDTKISLKFDAGVSIAGTFAATSDIATQ